MWFWIQTVRYMYQKPLNTCIWGYGVPDRGYLIRPELSRGRVLDFGIHECVGSQCIRYVELCMICGIKRRDRQVLACMAVTEPKPQTLERASANVFLATCMICLNDVESLV